MSLNTKGNFIISSTSTPSASEVANQQFTALSLKLGFESLASSDSGRSDDGVMHLNWVFRKIRKIEIEMPPYTNDEASKMATLLSLVQGRDYWITYFDNLTNAEKTIHVYTSNSAAECYSGILYNGVWQGLSFNAIQIDGES